MSERERLRRAEEIFFTLRRLTNEQRSAWLGEHCVDDPALLGEVHSLLESDPGHDSFLETPAAELELGWPGAPRANDVDPELIGSYRIERRIGEGGFGRVYLAEQDAPVRRRVAIKALKPGFGSRRLVARFQAELQTLARMDHPGIARVLDAGETEDGRPFYVMDYVAGIPLVEYCDSRALPLRARLELFVRLSEAVQHAHARGVIHRDLKPSNVLVVERDGRAQPVVIDFGVAKSLLADAAERPFDTQDGVLIGTLDYMSPEQAGGRRDEVDIRSDVYSLGVMLYELCAGQRPHDFAGQAPLDAARRILEQPVRRPSALRPELRGDLDTILLKSLAKEPQARYATAAALHEDLKRSLDGRAILAHPPSVWYAWSRFARRNRLVVAIGLLALLATVLGVAGLGRGFVLARHAGRVARAEQAKAQELGDFLLRMLRSVDPAVARGREVTMLEVLDEAQRRLEAGFDGSPEVEATLRSSIGEALRRLGRFDLARPHLERALELVHGVHGPLHRNTLRNAYFVAQLDADVGELAVARERLQTTLDAQVQSLGASDGDVLETRAALGDVQLRVGRPELARELLESALAGFAELHGADPARRAWVRARLGAAVLQLGRDDEALEHIRGALEVQRAAFGDQHPDSAASLRLLARALSSAGRLREAIDAAHGANAAYSAIHSADHDLALASLREEVELCARAGVARQAERGAMQHAVLVGMRFGMESEESLEATRLLGEVCLETGRMVDAARALTGVAELRAAQYGVEDVEALARQTWVAKLLLRRDELDSAHSLAERVESQLTDAVGTEDHRTLEARAVLGAVQQRRGDSALAAQTLHGLPSALAATLGAQHPDVFECALSLAEARRDLGRVGDAIETLENALAGFELATVEGRAFARVLVASGALLWESDDRGLARSRLNRALEILESIGAGDDGEARRARAVLER